MKKKKEVYDATEDPLELSMIYIYCCRIQIQSLQN